MKNEATHDYLQQAMSQAFANTKLSPHVCYYGKDENYYCIYVNAVSRKGLANLGGVKEHDGHFTAWYGVDKKACFEFGTIEEAAEYIITTRQKIDKSRHDNQIRQQFKGTKTKRTQHQYVLHRFSKQDHLMLDELVEFALKELKVPTSTKIYFGKSSNGSGICSPLLTATEHNDWFSAGDKYHELKIADPTKYSAFWFLLVLFHELAHLQQNHVGDLRNGCYKGEKKWGLKTGDADYRKQPQELDANRKGLKLVFKAAEKFGIKLDEHEVSNFIDSHYIKDMRPLKYQFFEAQFKRLTNRGDDANLSAPSTSTVRKETPMTDQTLTVSNAILEIIKSHGPLQTSRIKSLLAETYPDLELDSNGKKFAKVGNALAHHKTHARLMQNADKAYCLPEGASKPDAPKADAPVATETETRKVPTPQEMRDKVKLDHKKAAVAANTDTAVVKYLKQSIYLTRMIEEFLADKIIPLVHDGTATDPKVIESGGKIFIKFKDASGDTDTEVVCDFTDETARPVLESTMIGINKDMENIVGGASLVPKLEVALEQELAAPADDAETPEAQTESTDDDADSPELATLDQFLEALDIWEAKNPVSRLRVVQVSDIVSVDQVIDDVRTDMALLSIADYDEVKSHCDNANKRLDEAQASEASNEDDASIDKDELWRLYQSNTELFAGVIAEAQDAEGDAEAKAQEIADTKAALDVIAGQKATLEARLAELEG